MRRFLLDTGIAALHLDRKRGVFERAAVEVAGGNRVGIAAPVLAELAFAPKAAPSGTGTSCASARRSTCGNSGWWTLLPRSSTAGSRSS